MQIFPPNSREQPTASEAAAFFYRLLPDADCRHRVLHTLADAIEVADGVSGYWGITVHSRPKLLRLNNGGTQAFDLDGGGIRILLAPAEIPPVFVSRQVANRTYPSADGARLLAFGFDELDQLASVAEAQREAASEAHRRQYNFKRSHRFDVLDFIEAEVGRKLPRPVWWNEIGRDRSETTPLAPSGGAGSQAYSEGGEKLAVHRYRERDPRARAVKIEQARTSDGRLPCEVCGFDFALRYGEIGDGFIHVHHLKPLGGREGSEPTRVEDLALLCANCHEMSHRGAGDNPRSPADLRVLLGRQRVESGATSRPGGVA